MIIGLDLVLTACSITTFISKISLKVTLSAQSALEKLFL